MHDLEIMVLFEEFFFFLKGKIILWVQTSSIFDRNIKMKSLKIIEGETIFRLIA